LTNPINSRLVGKPYLISLSEFPGLAHNKLFRSFLSILFCRSFFVDPCFDLCFDSQLIGVFLETATSADHPLISGWRATKSAAGLDLSTLEISGPFHDFPRVGRNFCLTTIIYLYKLNVMNDLDAAFSALSDPTRRAILARLAAGEATVNELAEPFEMTQPAISQHLKVLEDAGLIVRRVEGTKRPRRLAKAGIEAMDQWLAMLRKALEANYDRLDEVLAGMEKTEKGKKKGKKR
jgi:DNA-binding transcriptional ArsR family regulator